MLSDRNKAEEQLRHIEKMDAIGNLVGGIAHDFNNMIAGIMGCAQLSEPLLSKENKKAKKYNSMIIDTSVRAAELTEKLLSFSRKQPNISTNVNVHKILNDTLVIVKNTIDRRINIKINLLAETSIIRCDPSQLQNTFLNLIINASHAITNNGTIKISSTIVALDSQYCENSTFDITPGKHIQIEIHDSGSGINDRDLPNIFDPFFTTKDPEKGTGLGLSTVFGMIRQHKGAINVYSEINVGTNFQILLPLSEQQQISEKRTSPENIQGSAKILVIDDESILRQTAEEFLIELGYEVLLAENGKVGVDIFKQERDTIDLILLDMIMPEMNGKDCFIEINKISPNTPIILISGFYKEEDLKELKLLGLNHFIHKPYNLIDLGSLIKKILSEKKS